MKKAVAFITLSMGFLWSYGQDIKIHANQLYPEGSAYSHLQRAFFVSSNYKGQVSKIDFKGNLTPFTNDPELVASLGMLADDQTNTLYVTNVDNGAALKSSKATTNKLSQIIAYDLETGKRKFMVDLGKLNPDHPNLINDLTMDNEGNLYVTNSFSPIIFKIDKQHHASIFIQNKDWEAAGFGLNGIIYHPGGYLLVAHSVNGCVYKISLQDPPNFKKVSLENVKDADGLILDGKSELVIICNTSGKIFKAKSTDNWVNARIVKTKQSAMDFPTTGVRANNAFYIVNSKLLEMFNPKALKSSDFLLQKVSL